MNENELIVINLGQEFEADSVIAALEDGGIPAYKKARPNSGLLAIPGALGLSENGFDVVVSKDNGQKAALIVAGLGYQPLVEIDDAEPEPENDTEQEKEAETAVEQPQGSAFSRVLLAIISLVLIAGVVWLVDYIINVIRGMV